MSIVYQHLTSDETKGYCAVLCVQTPVEDDSGIAHAIEHLVFRRSQGIESPYYLFQLLALLPVSINASTEKGLTYFHCSSESYLVFEFALEYILHSISSLALSESDLPLELGSGTKRGVMHRELAATDTELQIAGTRFYASRLLCSDNRPERIVQVGGTKGGLPELGLDSLQSYYQAYYQPSNIKLYTQCNRHKTINIDKIKRCLSLLNFQSQALPIPINNQTRAPDTIEVTTAPTQPLVEYLWWLSCDESTYCMLNEKVASLYAGKLCVVLPASKLTNKDGHWPIRVVTTPNEALTYYIANCIKDFLLAPLSRNTNEGQKTNKMPQEISTILSLHYGQKNTVAAKEPSPELKKFQQRQLNFAFTLSQQPTKLANQTPPEHSTSLPQPLMALLSLLVHHRPMVLSHHDKLPVLFTTIAAGLSDVVKPYYAQAVVTSQHYYCQWRVSAADHLFAWHLSFILSALPNFLSRRTEGYCYAIGCRYCPKQRTLAIYSAYDTEPAKVNSHIEQSFKYLSRAYHFIEEALPFARLKVESARGQANDMMDVNVIHQQQISDYISNLQININ